MSDVTLLKMFRSLTTMLTRAGVSIIEVYPNVMKVYGNEGDGDEGGDDERSGDEDGVFTFLTIHLHHVGVLLLLQTRQLLLT